MSAGTGTSIVFPSLSNSGAGSWLYRKSVSLTGSAGAGTNYQVKVLVGESSGTPGTNVNVDSHSTSATIFNDVRFTASNGTTELYHWQEGTPTGSSPNRIATYWVKVNDDLGTSQSVYIYYGDASAASASSYFNTFDVLGDGSSGALTVSSANTIVNTYAYLTGNEPAGDSTIAINNGTGFSNGDEILIIQMQNYSGGIAGTYEFRKISSGGGTTSLTLNAPLKNSYASGTFDSTTATVAQVVRVPQYTNVTINNGASITAAAWNGYSGGIVAFKANGTVTIVSGGIITATAKGFRADVGCCVALGAINGNGSEGYKGKGNYDQLATWGGGGAGKLCANSNAAGGGGGSYATAGTAGYIQGSCTPGAGSTTIFGSSDLSVLFFGGAGGHGYAGPGSNHGGGIILISANILSNSGTITARGGDGGQVIAPSAAGAGGSIFITASTLTAGSSTILATAGAAAIAEAGAGGSGRIRLSYNSITGTSDPAAYTTGFDTDHYRKHASPEPIGQVGTPTPPTIPQISSPSNNSRHYNNSINYTWNQSTDTESDPITYDFWLSSQSNFSNTVNRTNFTNNWTGNITTTKGRIYYAKVRANDSYNYSAWSPTVQFWEGKPSLISPTNGSTITTLQVQFTWFAENANYIFVLSKDPTFTTYLRYQTLTTNSTTVPIFEDEQYFWKVGLSTGEWSTVNSFNLSAVSLGSGDGTTGIQGYVYESLTLVPIPNAIVFAYSTTNTSSVTTDINGYYLFKNLTNNTLYTLKAVAENYEENANNWLWTVNGTWVTKHIIMRRCTGGLTCYYDQEFQTIIVMRTNDSMGITGVTVQIYKDATLVDTKLTDSNGYATSLLTKDQIYTVTITKTDVGISDTKTFYTSTGAPWEFRIGTLTYVTPVATPDANLSTYNITYTDRAWSLQNFTSTYLNSSIGLGTMGQGILTGIILWVVVGAGGVLTTIFVSGALVLLGVLSQVTLLFFILTAVSVYLLTKV